MKEKRIITKKGVKGEDGYRVFSIRIKEDPVEKPDRLARQTNRSRNDLINTLLDFAVAHCEAESPRED